jgi:hypothetical protein
VGTRLVKKPGRLQTHLRSVAPQPLAWTAARTGDSYWTNQHLRITCPHSSRLAKVSYSALRDLGQVLGADSGGGNGQKGELGVLHFDNVWV